MDLTNYIFGVAEWLGIIAFSISGAMLAVERRFDLFGVITLGVISTLGGGIIRDLLLGQTPPRFFYNYRYVLVSALISVAVFAVAKRVSGKNNSLGIGEKLLKLNMIFDAIGLGAFTVTGVQAAMDFGHEKNAFLCISLGVITGIGGGVLRDMMSQRAPAILVKHIYAVAAIIGAILYYWLFIMAVDQRICLMAGMVSTVVVRLLASHYRWGLPKAY